MSLQGPVLTLTASREAPSCNPFNIKINKCNKTKSHQLCDDLLLVGTPDNSSRFFNRFAPDKFLPLLRQCSPPLSGASRLTLYAVSRLTISDNFLRFLRSFALENSLHFFRRFAPENITQSRLTRRSAPEAAMARFGPTFRTLYPRPRPCRCPCPRHRPCPRPRFSEMKRTTL